MGQKKCPVCNSCMSRFWILPDMYYYCSFCRQYYSVAGKDIFPIESPYKDRVEEASNKVEDPIMEEDNE